MGDTRVWTTGDFKRKAAGAKIICTRCGHSVTVTPPIIARMFPVAMPLDRAQRQLRCSRCNGRTGQFEILRFPAR